MKIRIKSANAYPYAWYASDIGKEYEVVKEHPKGYEVSNPDGKLHNHYFVGKEDCVIVTEEESAPITVLPDESLGGIQREYREVKRQARVGELVKMYDYFHGNDGDVLKVRGTINGAEQFEGKRDGEGSPQYIEGRKNGGHVYVTLEPTDIVYLDDTDGISRKYRMVDREAAVGERVIIVNEGSESFGGRYYRIGNVGTVTVDATTSKNILVDFSENDEYLDDGRWNVSPGDYRVLEPVEETPSSLSTRHAADQIAENIANLTAKVTELETRLNALYDWHKRAAVDIRVAREDIVLVEEGVADDIKALESRVAALEDSAGPCVKVASGPVDRTPPDFIKTPQQIRDEIVERAKADVKALLNTPEYGIEALDGAYISYIPHIHRVKFVINRDKRTIVALVQDRRTDKLRLRGIAKCAPNDVFNAHIGRAIALRRALGLEVPTEYLNAPNPTEVRVGDVVDEIKYYNRKNRVVEALRPPGYDDADKGLTFVGGGWAYIDACQIVDDTRESEKGAAA